MCQEPFPGIHNALQLLKGRGVNLAVVTGKGPGSAEISLRYLRLAGYFDAVECGSADGDVKAARIQEVLTRWRLPPEEAAYVGDSPSDMEVARAAGVIPLAAAWDATADIEGLLDKAPRRLFRDVESFMAWVRKNVEANHRKQ
jgi:phosphoglycolate phosphatase-like HAD superfamily hydrolase